MKYLTIDIGGTFTKYAVMDEDLKIYEKSKVPTEKASVEAYIDMIVGLYEKYRSEAAGQREGFYADGRSDLLY